MEELVSLEEGGFMLDYIEYMMKSIVDHFFCLGTVHWSRFVQAVQSYPLPRRNGHGLSRYVGRWRVYQSCLPEPRCSYIVWLQISLAGVNLACL